MMKENLFEILLNLFEKTITHIKENNLYEDERNNSSNDEPIANAFPKNPESTLIVKKASPNSLRIYNEDEMLQFTKSSYQFWIRFTSWGIVEQGVLELVLHQLLLSKEPVIKLDDLKVSIRNAVANILDSDQLAYLDLVLYQREDGLLPN